MKKRGLSKEMGFTSYVICSTPRSGSTMLCDLLASTEVAGKPHSYYRNTDASDWAKLWGVPPPHQIGDPPFERAYLSAMIRNGTGETGIFGLRIMWSSIAEASARLDCIEGDREDISVRFEKAFGPTLYIHLSRQDKLAQAISYLRAEQSGLWHRGADGTERERTAPPRKPVYNAERIAKIVTDLTSDENAWKVFFERRKISPIALTYETFSPDPKSTAAKILSALSRDPTASDRIRIQTSRLADDDSRQWAERFRRRGVSRSETADPPRD